MKAFFLAILMIAAAGLLWLACTPARGAVLFDQLADTSRNGLVLQHAVYGGVAGPAQIQIASTASGQPSSIVIRLTEGFQIHATGSIMLQVRRGFDGPVIWAQAQPVDYEHFQFTPPFDPDPSHWHDIGGVLSDGQVHWLTADVTFPVESPLPLDGQEVFCLSASPLSFADAGLQDETWLPYAWTMSALMTPSALWQIDYPPVPGKDSRGRPIMVPVPSLRNWTAEPGVPLAPPATGLAMQVLALPEPSPLGFALAGCSVPFFFRRRAIR